jgi:hypothetical protein
MKIYKFFLKPDKKEKNNGKTLQERYVLYAITNKKEFARMFKEQRDMSKFLFKVDSSIDKDEWDSMASELRGSVLSKTPLLTCDNDKARVKKNIVTVKVLMTLNEKLLIDENVENPSFEDERLWDSMPIPLIFKEKYRRALETLQYTLFYKVLNTSSIYIEPAFQKYTEKIDEYSVPDVSVDELSIFIGLFNNILK